MRGMSTYKKLTVIEYGSQTKRGEIVVRLNGSYFDVNSALQAARALCGSDTPETITFEDNGFLDFTERPIPDWTHRTQPAWRIT